MDRNVLLLKEMIRYYARDPKRIQHFIKVHDFAGMIGKLEGLEDDEQNILEIAAIVHDIGIKVSMGTAAVSIRSWKVRLSQERCWKPWALRTLLLTEYVTWLPIIILIRILTGLIIRFLWRLIFL